VIIKVAGRNAIQIPSDRAPLSLAWFRIIPSDVESRGPRPIIEIDASERIPEEICMINTINTYDNK
jgi:hypothetical protein